jgi:hypothetical protein
LGDRKARLPQPSGFMQVPRCNSGTVGTLALAMVGSSSTSTAESPADVGREPTTVGSSSTPTAESLANDGREPTTVSSSSTHTTATTGGLTIYIDEGETRLCLDNVLPGQSVWSIKRMIQQQLGLVARSPACVLIRNGQRVLRDMMSVSECGITMGQVLSADTSRCWSRGDVVADVAEEDVMHAAASPSVVDPESAHVGESMQIIVNTSSWDVLGLTVQPSHAMWSIKAMVLDLLGLGHVDPSSTELYALRDREKLTDLRTVRECGINSGSNLYFDEAPESANVSSRVVSPADDDQQAGSLPMAKARAARQATSRSRSR